MLHKMTDVARDAGRDVGRWAKRCGRRWTLQGTLQRTLQTMLTIIGDAKAEDVAAGDAAEDVGSFYRDRGRWKLQRTLQRMLKMTPAATKDAGRCRHCWQLQRTMDAQGKVQTMVAATADAAEIASIYRGRWTLAAGCWMLDRSLDQHAGH